MIITTIILLHSRRMSLESSEFNLVKVDVVIVEGEAYFVAPISQPVPFHMKAIVICSGNGTPTF